MAIYPVENMQTIAKFYEGWNETMIWSCLQGCMGSAFADDSNAPQSAQISTGCFHYFAGVPNMELLQNLPAETFALLAPQNNEWGKAIEAAYPLHATKRIRFATKKDPHAFDTEKLQRILAALPAEYTLQPIDASLYSVIMASGWAVDLCYNFNSYDDYHKNGVGFAILKDGVLVSGASSYTYYKTGIEIQIDTREDYQRKGLASICGAALLLECLRRNLYPSWDAHNKESLALATKLGYQFDKEYIVYDFYK